MRFTSKKCLKWYLIFVWRFNLLNNSSSSIKITQNRRIVGAPVIAEDLKSGGFRARSYSTQYYTSTYFYMHEILYGSIYAFYARILHFEVVC